MWHLPNLCPHRTLARTASYRWGAPSKPLNNMCRSIHSFHYRNYHAYLYVAAAATAKSLQSCPTLCDPIDGSSPGSPVPGILQARTLEWVAISFSNAWKWKVKVKSLSRVRPSVTPWTTALQAPPSMGFSRQEHWSGVPLPCPIFMLMASKSYKHNKSDTYKAHTACYILF